MRFSQVLFLHAIVLGLYSCTGREVIHAKGGKFYGGVFKFMVTEKVTNLFTLSSLDTYTERLKSQLYDPLLKMDVSSMKITPSIVSSYAVSSEGRTFTMKIRKGIRFHDDPCFEEGSGRNVTAHDVKFSLDIACSGLKINDIAYLLINKIVGAEDFYKRSKAHLPKSGVSGIKVIDDYTLEISLVNPNIEFDKVLTYPGLSVISKEAFDYYGDEIIVHPVGTGPFILESMDEEGVKLKRNDHYWAKDVYGNQLPFIDEVEMTYAKNKKAELIAFRNKKTDVVFDIPVEEIEYVLGSLEDAQAGKTVTHKIESFTGMNVHFIGFASQSKEFADINVRRAFNYAINRRLIIEEYLLGDGVELNSAVPLIGEMESAHNGIKGYDFDVKKAKELLANAGYPNGENFPIISLYTNAVDAWKAKKMCESIAQQLKQHLNVNVKVVYCSLAQREKAVKEGKAKMWKSGWAADYPSAETFLRLFYTGKDQKVSNLINQFKYRNPSFDKEYESALSEKNPSKRAKLFALCDQMVVNEAVIIPIMSNSQTIMVNSVVKGLKQNSIESMDFATVYFNRPRIQ